MTHAEHAARARPLQPLAEASVNDTVTTTSPTFAAPLPGLSLPQRTSAATTSIRRADQPAGAAGTSPIDRLRRWTGTLPMTTTSIGTGTATLATLRRQQSPPSTVRRSINYKPKDGNAYARDRKGLLGRLTSEFPSVDPIVLEKEIIRIEGLDDAWSPYDVYLGIKRWVLETYPPQSTVFGGETQITKDEARNYFSSNFKTFAEVIIDSSNVFKFTNVTEKDLHAEDNFMASIDKHVVQNRWHKDFSGVHTILMRINNSPCIRCAERLYDWKYRDVFVEFGVQFANMYEKGDNFNQATTRLRSGGVTMDLYSVSANLKDLLSKEELAARKIKDSREATDFAAWEKQRATGGGNKDGMSDQ